MTQTIPSGTWTQLDGHDADIWADAPATVIVVDGRLYVPAGVSCEVRQRSLFHDVGRDAGVPVVSVEWVA